MGLKKRLGEKYLEVAENKDVNAQETLKEAGCFEQESQVPALAHERLKQAIRSNKVEDVSLLIDAEVPLDETLGSEETAFTYAVQLGKQNIIELFLQKQPNLINTWNCYGQTALAIAAMKGDKDLCLYLLQAGANVNASSEITYDINEIANHTTQVKQTVTYESVALFFAATSGREAMVDWLIEMGGNINAIQTKARHIDLKAFSNECRTYEFNARIFKSYSIAGAPSIAPNELKTTRETLLDSVIKKSGEEPKLSSMVEKLRDLGAKCFEELDLKQDESSTFTITT